MKVKVSSTGGKITAELEGETKDIFQQISDFQEVFDVGCCGACQCEELKFQVRSVDDNNYYEIACRGCGARLAFGQTKRGGKLFPRRKDGDGNWLPNGGWVKWQDRKQREIQLSEREDFEDPFAR